MGEKIVKMLWFCTVLLLTTLIWREKLWIFLTVLIWHFWALFGFFEEFEVYNEWHPHQNNKFSRCCGGWTYCSSVWERPHWRYLQRKEEKELVAPKEEIVIMETPPSVEDTLACIATLYHNPNPEDKNRANQWLQSLQNSVYAWKVNYHEKFVKTQWFGPV